jgi:hypothetical protein
MQFKSKNSSGNPILDMGKKGEALPKIKVSDMKKAPAPRPDAVKNKGRKSPKC